MGDREDLQRSVMVHLLNEEERGRAVDPERLRKITALLGSVLYPNMEPDDLELVARWVEEKLDVAIAPAAVIKKGYEAWLDARRGSIDPYYWERYRQYLIQNGLPPRVVAELGANNDRVLDLLRDPTSAGPWDRRGLVMGNVQSGKTANYTGLICKAADAGFRVVVVIAGIHNNLRNQTQARIDEGFIGGHREQASAGVKYTRAGVGLLDARRMPVHFTSKNRDFSKATAAAVGMSLSDLAEPAVFVIKKNATTLKHLAEWLKEFNTRGEGKISAPLLLVDDEADNASINVAGKPDEVSKINGLIRSILDLFERSAYVGYTATPFANIFIDPESDQAMIGEDLFPRSFIVSLDAPTDYLGPTRVFEEEADRFLREIGDSEGLLPLSHKRTHRLQDIPETLRYALRSFIVTRAIRISRGQGEKHSSMLVNASRFIDVQSQLAAALVEELEVIRHAIRINSKLPPVNALRDTEMQRLHDVYLREFADSGVAWEHVMPLLHDAVSPVRVIQVNSRSAGTLNYSDHSKHGLHVVAVGGLSLSRGLTLEGLSTTYFLRNSIMYDTLLQMGRWFGYRPGYEDLCRIWLPPAAKEWYAHITESVEELRDDLRRMERAGGTPEDFGLKVRRHPDALIITARNKMGNAEDVTVHIGLGAKLAETSVLNRSTREHNLRAAERFVLSLQQQDRLPQPYVQVPGPSGFFAGGISSKEILKFLEDYKGNGKRAISDPSLVRDYILAQGERLGVWDVFIPSIAGDQATLSFQLGDLVGACQRRDSPRYDGDDFVHVTSRSRVAGRGVERVGLTADQAATAERAYREDNGDPEGLRAWNYPDSCYRKHRKRPLLVLHILAMKDKAGAADRLRWAAWSISFPDSGESEKTIAYRVNRVWIRENLGALEDATDEGDESDSD